MASFSTPSEASLPWSNPRVCVLGDVMVDAYMWGSVSRMSPEAPVPVVEVTRREQRVGGAGNVVKNLHALGATVDVIAVVGEDEAGRMLHGLLATMAKPTLLMDPSRRTTVKTRIISDGQHVVRVDEETTDSIDEAMQSLARKSLLTLLQGNDKPDVVVLEDYDKGFFSQGLVQAIIADCHTHEVPVVVDPKLEHFLDFTGVDLFKPNLKEVVGAWAFSILFRPRMHRQWLLQWNRSWPYCGATGSWSPWGNTACGCTPQARGEPCRHPGIPSRRG